MSLVKKSVRFKEEQLRVLQDMNQENNFSELVRRAIDKFIQNKDTEFDIDILDNIDVLDILGSNKDFYSVPEVAEIFDKHEDTIRKWCQKEWWTCTKFGGSWMIPQATLVAVVKKIRPRVVRVTNNILDDGYTKKLGKPIS